MEFSKVDKKTNLHLIQGCKVNLSGFAWLVRSNWWSQLQQLEQSIGMFACLSRAATGRVGYSILTSSLCVVEMQMIK